MSRKKKIAITTLGCKVNQFESAAFATAFQHAGCELVAFKEQADVYVINTCAVTARAGRQSRQLIRRAMRSNPEARLVVTGCYAQSDAQHILEIVENPVCIVGNGNKHLLSRVAIEERQCDLAMYMGDIRRKKEICSLPVERFIGRTRACLRVQDGCDNFCSYCIVPYTRGQSRSLPQKEVFAQAAVFAEQGYKEMVITGINVGKYGLDLAENETIISLLAGLCSRFPEMRLRLSSIEPGEVTEELLDLIAGHDNFLPHLHIPLQSGDDDILRRMNRRYSSEDFRDVILRCCERLANAAIGVDVLVGFPGESEQAFANTYELLAVLPVSYLHVFPYSRRPGTLAASMSPQITGLIRNERVATLRRLDAEKRTAFYQAHLGTTQSVLVEGPARNDSHLRGMTDNYIPVRFSGPEKLSNHVIRLRLDSIEEGWVAGTQQL